MKRAILIAALAAFPLVGTATEMSAADKREAATKSAPVPRVSQDKLDRIRQSLVAQIAAFDAAENAMRAPTSAEAAALATPAPTGAQAAVPLARGGMALRADISNASLAIADRSEDGEVRIGHDATSKARMGSVQKGVDHAH